MKISQTILRFSILVLLTMDISAAGLLPLNKINRVDPYSTTGKATDVWADPLQRTRDALMTLQYGQDGQKMLYAAPLFHAYHGAKDIFIPTFFSLRPEDVTLPASIQHDLGGRMPDAVFFIVTLINERPFDLGAHGGLLEARPHYWLDPTAPAVHPGYSHTQPFNITIFEPSPAGLTINGQPAKVRTHGSAVIHHDVGDPEHYVRSSGDDNPLAGYAFASEDNINKLDLSFYSVVNGRRRLAGGHEVEQTAVTLHCIIGPDRRAEIERLNHESHTAGEWAVRGGDHPCAEKLRSLLRVGH